MDFKAIASSPVPMGWISLKVSLNVFHGTIVLKKINNFSSKIREKQIIFPKKKNKNATYLSAKDVFQNSAASLLVILKLSPLKEPPGNTAFNSLSI